MPDTRYDQGPGPAYEGAWKSIIRRAQERRTKLARQSWKDFFRGFAIEVAAVVAIVIVVALVLSFLH